MKPKEFVSSLRDLRFDNVFNPYSDRCVLHDVSDAPSRRAKTLLKLLEAAARTEIDALWIGRDLGYRGHIAASQGGIAYGRDRSCR